jgi:DNA-binding response OmpR family regulator
VVERALAAGAEEFIRKPFENQELIARIRVRLSA